LVRQRVPELVKLGRAGSLDAAQTPEIIVYLIDRGSFKTVARIRGRDQITGFYFPTYLLGLDGGSDAFHLADTIALESSVVRVIRFSSSTAFCRDAPVLQSQVGQIANAEAARIAQAAAPLGSRMAKERIASFLLDTSSKFEAAGRSPTDLAWSISRQELANYLGTRIETVSRILTMFRDEGILELQGKHIFDSRSSASGKGVSCRDGCEVKLTSPAYSQSFF